MIVKKIKKIEDCLEASNVRDILLDGFLTKKFIDYLGQLGKYIYNDEFAKPFFSIIVRGKYTIKGAQGNKTLRIMLPDTVETNDYLDSLKNYIEKF